MNRNLILSCIALVLIAFAACHKPAEPSVTKFTTSDTMFRLINNSARALHVDMYRSNNDRKNQANVSYACVVPAKGIFKIPFSQLDTTAVYYYDLYTEDYSYSNWATSDQGYPLFYTGHAYAVDTHYFTKACGYFLNSHGTSSSWKAINKYSWGNTSVWASITPNERYMQITLNRNITGMVSTKQFDGTSVDIVINRATASDDYNGLSRLTLFSNMSSSTQYTLYNSAIVPDYNYDYVVSRDTIMVYDNSYYWLMVRQ